MNNQEELELKIKEAIKNGNILDIAIDYISANPEANDIYEFNSRFDSLWLKIHNLSVNQRNYDISEIIEFFPNEQVSKAYDIHGASSYILFTEEQRNALILRNRENQQPFHKILSELRKNKNDFLNSYNRELALKERESRKFVVPVESSTHISPSSI